MPTQASQEHLESIAVNAMSYWSERYRILGAIPELIVFGNSEGMPYASIQAEAFVTPREISDFMDQQGFVWGILSMVGDLAVGSPSQRGTFLTDGEHPCLAIWLYYPSGRDALWTRPIASDGSLCKTVKRWEPEQFCVLEPRMLETLGEVTGGEA